jgi:hypothetical protein
MEQKSIEHVTTVVLRFVGVLTIFIGLILVTYTIFQLLAAQSVTSGFPQGLPRGMSVSVKGAAGRLGAWAIAAQIAVMVWGGLLFALAKPIAERIAGAPTPSAGDTTGQA